MNEILKIQSVSKNYGATKALDGVNISIGEGRIVGLLGPNGSGKTTLIKIIAGLLQADSGSVSVCGQPVGAESKKLVAYLPDKCFLSEWMTVGQMLRYTADFFEDFDCSRAEDMIESLRIPLNVQIKRLSKGTKEKLSLAITMSRRAKLYILDEPIAGVDPAARDYVIRTILANYSPQSSVLISTHLIADVEPVLSDVIFINQGNVVLEGTVDEIRREEGRSVDALFREVFRCY